MHIHQRRQVIVILSFVIGLEAYIRASRGKGKSRNRALQNAKSILPHASRVSGLAKSTSTASKVSTWSFQFQAWHRRYTCLRTDTWASLKAQSVALNTDGKEAEILKSENSLQLGEDHLE